MNRQYRIEESGVFLALDVSEKGEVFFLHCQRRPFAEESIVPEQKEWYRLVEIQAAGEDCDDHHACKYTGTLPGRRLVFTGLSDERTARGRCITVTQKDGLTGLKVKSILQFIGLSGNKISVQVMLFRGFRRVEECVCAICQRLFFS